MDGWMDEKGGELGLLQSLENNMILVLSSQILRVNLGDAEYSWIIELRWCCLRVGSFCSSLKWALLILLRAL